MHLEGTSRRLVIATLAILGLMLLAVPRSAGAFAVSGVGGRLGYANPENLDGTTAVSVHAEMEQAGTRVHLMPSVGYWNVNRVSDLSPNLDLYYHFAREGQVSPYLGGGLGLNFVRDERRERNDTNLGMNLLGGVAFPGSRSSARRYFLEGRYTASDVNQVAVLTGLTFGTP